MNQWLGLLRSLVIYHNPALRRAWRRFYGEVLDPGDIAFDVGAHVGTRARAMRSAGARVIALEPQSLFAGFLRRTLPRDIVLVEAAAGRVEGGADMAISSRHPTVSSLQPDFVSGAATAPSFAHVVWDKRQRVEVVTLDGLIAQFGVPRYVKIDVEGFELDVLAGLTQPVAMVSVEFLPEFVPMTRAVIERLAELGDYRFNPVVGETARFLWPDWAGAEATQDWLASLPADYGSGDLFARLEGA